MQVDALLQSLASICCCSLSDLFQHHQQAHLIGLGQVLDSLKPVQQLAAYAHVLLPWQTVHAAARAAASGTLGQQQQPEAWWPKIQVGAMGCSYFNMKYDMQSCKGGCLWRRDAATRG